MTDTTDTSVVADQPPLILTIPQAPSFCRLCEVELRAPETWRSHAKSDGHVYKLRSKLAEPGNVISPPPPAPSTEAGQPKSPAPSRSQKRDELDAAAPQDQNVASDKDDEPQAPEFVAGNCLFCKQESSTLDDNMTHMAATHGFSVPFQDCLAVDIETVVWYLHFVINAYRECISCGTQRSTVEGVQQHMVAKGHCRFDISPDTEEFYEIPQSENALIEQTQRESSMPVRLPSGKLISHRKNPDTQEPRPARRATPDRVHLDSFASRPESSSTPGLEVAKRGGNGSGEIVRSSEAILAAQLSRLRIADTRVQQAVEQRKRGRLEQANNIIWLKHFKVDSGDSRWGREF